jgi:hypothetical protein
VIGNTYPAAFLCEYFPGPMSDLIREQVETRRPGLSAAAQDLYDRFVPHDMAVAREILDADVSVQAALLPAIAAKTLHLLESKTRWTAAHRPRWLLGQMLRANLPLREKDLILLAEHTGTLRSHWRFDTIVPLAPLLDVVEQYVKTNGLSDAMRSTLTELQRRVEPYKANRRVAARIEVILHS